MCGNAGCGSEITSALSRAEHGVKVRGSACVCACPIEEHVRMEDHCGCGSRTKLIGSSIEVNEVVALFKTGDSGVSLSGFGAGISISSRHCVFSGAA